VNRFAGNEALFTKFLKKFVDDPTFSDLRKAMAGTDADEAFRQAHTLKGVVGNLSFDDLFEKLNPVVEALRAGDLDTAKTLFPAVEAEYERAIEGVKQIG